MNIKVSKQPEYDIAGLTVDQVKMLYDIIHYTSASDIYEEGDEYDELCDFLSDLHSILEERIND